MSAPTPVVPPHGTTARYQGTRRTSNRPPCRCRACVDAHTRACARRALAHLRGAALRVPTAPVTAHLHALTIRTPTATYASIARAAGVSPAVVRNIARGVTPTVNATTARAILAVTRLGPAPDGAYVASVGTVRRVRALYAVGHGPVAIAPVAGMSRTGVRDLAGGRETVTAATARAIEAVYARLAHVEGTSWAARRVAARHGWPDPLWWEDYGHLDDPAFDSAEVSRPLTRDERAALRRADITHLADHGHTPETIQARLAAAGDTLALTTVQAIVLEHRTGVRRDRRVPR